MQDEYEIYKIVVIGDSGTGKTNVSTRYVRDYFAEVCQTTLGVEFMNKLVDVNGKKIKISLWDTAGQERYRALSKVYYKGASAAIIVYDVTDANSYVNVESWMKLLSDSVNVEDVIIVVVGNKSDLESERQVSKERPIHEFKDSFDIDCWEVSAKTGANVNEMFEDVVRKIVEKANDIKGTMYRGTGEYSVSERGTYLDGNKSMIPGQNEPNNRVANPSIIIEQEDDQKSHTVQVGLRQDIEIGNYPNNRLTLSKEERKEHNSAVQKKKKKCC